MGLSFVLRPTEGGSMMEVVFDGVDEVVVDASEYFSCCWRR